MTGALEFILDNSGHGAPSPHRGSRGDGLHVGPTGARHGAVRPCPGEVQRRRRKDGHTQLPKRGPLRPGAWALLLDVDLLFISNLCAKVLAHADMGAQYITTRSVDHPFLGPLYKRLIDAGVLIPFTGEAICHLNPAFSRARHGRPSRLPCLIIETKWHLETTKHERSRLSRSRSEARWRGPTPTAAPARRCGTSRRRWA